jgi:hypothetical protein
MGSSGWSYFTPYQEDIAQALQELRQRVFEAGEYQQYWLYVEASINISSGRVVIAGCTDYFPDAIRIPVEPGTYRVRIYYGGLASISEDGLEGEDHYQVVLWPEKYSAPKILKKLSS